MSQRRERVLVWILAIKKQLQGVLTIVSLKIIIISTIDFTHQRCKGIPLARWLARLIFKQCDSEFKSLVSHDVCYFVSTKERHTYTFPCFIFFIFIICYSKNKSLKLTLRGKLTCRYFPNMFWLRKWRERKICWEHFISYNKSDDSIFSNLGPKTKLLTESFNNHSPEVTSNANLDWKWKN
jgi:hypothetical protein